MLQEGAVMVMVVHAHKQYPWYWLVGSPIITLLIVLNFIISTGGYSE